MWMTSHEHVYYQNHARLWNEELLITPFHVFGHVV